MQIFVTFSEYPNFAKGNKNETNMHSKFLLYL